MKQILAIILVIVLGVWGVVSVANALQIDNREMKTSTWRVTEPEPTPANYKEYDIQPFVLLDEPAPRPEPTPAPAVLNGPVTEHYLILPGNGLARVVMDITAGEVIISLALLLVFTSQIVGIVLNEVGE